MKNEDFLNNKQWENKINLQSLMQTRVLKYTGIEIPVEMCRVILSYVNPSQQLYLDCYNLEEITLPDSVANGYTYTRGILTRNIVTVIAGNVIVGYNQNKRLIEKTQVKSKLAVLKITSFTTGSRDRKFVNKIKDTLIFIRGVDYAYRFTDIKNDNKIM